MKISFIKSPSVSGSKNMELDLKIFEEVEKNISPSTLRFYQWANPCISLGYSQNSDNFLDILECSRNGLEVIKRPTGGGICFHNQEEITFSFSFGREKSSYKSLRESLRFLPQIILSTLKTLGIEAEFKKVEEKVKVEKEEEKIPFCFAVPIFDEIVVNNSKIVGFAQKITKKAVLQQGTIMIKNDLIKLLPFSKENVEIKNDAIVDTGLEEILQKKIDFDRFCGLVEDMIYSQIGIDEKHYVCHPEIVSGSKKP